MLNDNNKGLYLLSICIFLGAITIAIGLICSISKYRSFDRTVSVRGLSERDVESDIVLAPINITFNTDSLDEGYSNINSVNNKLLSFLKESGIKDEEITVCPIAVEDKASYYMGYNKDSTTKELRYKITQNVNISSNKIMIVKNILLNLSKITQNGVLIQANYVEYIFTKLNEIKPSMIEEATLNAREVAQKFAQDSKSQLGKIQSANQGTFTINTRDSNNPHIKTIRVVSTIVYYLND